MQIKAIGTIAAVSAIAVMSLEGVTRGAADRASSPQSASIAVDHSVAAPAGMPRLDPFTSRTPALGGGQAAAAAPAVPANLLAENVFKNVQALKGISAADFMGTMGIMSASLGFDCSECHNAAGTDKVDWANDTPRKVIGRRMVNMVAAINRDNFGGRQLVTCWVPSQPRQTFGDAGAGLCVWDTSHRARRPGAGAGARFETGDRDCRSIHSGDRRGAAAANDDQHHRHGD